MAFLRAASVSSLSSPSSLSSLSSLPSLSSLSSFLSRSSFPSSSFRLLPAAAFATAAAPKPAASKAAASKPAVPKQQQQQQRPATAAAPATSLAPSPSAAAAASDADPAASATAQAPSLDKLRADMRGRSLLGFLENEQVGKMGLRTRQAMLDRSQPDHLAPGCVVQVQMISSKTSKRRTAFTGTCIAVRRNGIGSNFVLRNTVLDEGVEITFPLYSPLITSIRVLKRERVRRAKLYYLKGNQEKDVVVSESSFR